MSVNQTDDIKDSIFRYLNIREHSKLELFEKLLKKNFKKEEIKECILEFEEKGLQSDKRYAELYAKSRFENQKGPYLIESNLRKNGVDRNIIKETLLTYTENDWESAALTALEKKSLAKRTSTDQEKTEKQKMFLKTRGFSTSIIISAINQFWKS